MVTFGAASNPVQNSSSSMMLPCRARSWQDVQPRIAAQCFPDSTSPRTDGATAGIPAYDLRSTSSLPIQTTAPKATANTISVSAILPSHLPMSPPRCHHDICQENYNLTSVAASILDERYHSD